jgi:uncharacterized protein (TIGR00255 family)
MKREDERDKTMTKSMTGFAKAELEDLDGKLYGEVRALNSRYLEINMKLPRTEYSYEQRLRELIKRHISRGKIDITIKWERPGGQSVAPRVNETSVKQYMEVIKDLKANFGLRGNPTIENILNFRDVITYEEPNSLSEETLFATFEALLKNLDEERVKEGELIRKDFLLRLNTIMASLREIEERQPVTFKAHEEKLKEKMLEITKSTSIDEIRVLQELAIFMERLDIAEEIMRLQGHIDNFRTTIEATEPIGRKLDFIVQEMVRETNTIGSKSNDLYINERVIKMKVEIEKMREQVQNVE